MELIIGLYEIWTTVSTGINVNTKEMEINHKKNATTMKWTDCTARI